MAPSSLLTQFAASSSSDTTDQRPPGMVSRTVHPHRESRQPAPAAAAAPHRAPAWPRPPGVTAPDRPAGRPPGDRFQAMSSAPPLIAHVAHAPGTPTFYYIFVKQDR